MTVRSILRPLAALSVGAAFASSPSLGDEKSATATKTPAVATAATKAPIWKLSDDDSTVFLAGSVHLLRERDMPIPKAFDTVYEQCEELVFEIDMASMMNPATALKIREMGSLPEGESLAEKIDGEVMDNLRAYLADQGLPRELFDRFTPGMVYVTLGSLEAVRSGARPELGLEATFYRKSVADGKPSRGLETAAYQISLFNQLKPETVEDMIRSTLAEKDESEETLDSLIAAWRSGDPEKISGLIVDQLAESPEVKQILLVDRNRNWIPEIEKALTGKKNVMFLVGAAHLAGEGSVIDLLGKKGRKLTQVDATP
jgi:uncharacterized protein YbaP (TraB family)